MKSTVFVFCLFLKRVVNLVELKSQNFVCPALGGSSYFSSILLGLDEPSGLWPMHACMLVESSSDLGTAGRQNLVLPLSDFFFSGISPTSLFDSCDCLTPYTLVILASKAAGFTS